MYMYNTYHFLKFKYFLCLNGKIFDLKKTSLKCYGFFSCSKCIFFETVGKIVCITMMDTDKNYSRFTIIQC